MPKINLDRVYIFQGKQYGPGEADIPDEMHQSLTERGLLDSEPQQNQSRAASTSEEQADAPEQADARPAKRGR